MTHRARLAILITALTIGSTRAVSQSLMASPPSQSSVIDCEVHVWPTRNGVANVLGMASILLPLGFLVDQAGHKKTDQSIGAVLVEKIPPDAQAAAMKREDVISALRLPPATRVVIEDTLPAYEEVEKNPAAKQRVSQMSTAIGAGARLSGSHSPCYAELLVSGVGYARSPLDPPVLAVRWIYRRWHDGKITQVAGWRRHQVSAELGTNDNISAASDALMQSLYASTFIEWARKKVKS